MLFTEYLPAPPLRSIIRYYGILEQNKSFDQPFDEVSPASLTKGLLFHIRREGAFLHDNGVYKGHMPYGYIMTQGTKPNHWKFDKEWSILGVIFQPGMFRKAFPFSTVDLSDYFILFDDLPNKSYLELLERLWLAKDHATRISILDSFFLQEFKYIDTSEDYVDVFIKSLFQSTNMPIHKLTKEIPMTERHFRRYFLRAMGFSPKKYQRMVKFAKAFHMLQSGNFKKLSDLAYSCGYYDQSTFIREFKQFLDTTPTEFLKQMNPFAESIHWKDRSDDYS